jgi:hypothetical protein
MTSMPTIDDRMVAELRRTGKRQATYSRARSSRVVSNGSRVVLQQAVGLGCGDPNIRDCVVSCGLGGEVCVGGHCVSTHSQEYADNCGYRSGVQ